MAENKSTVRAFVVLIAIGLSTLLTGESQAVQRLDRSQPPAVVASTGGFSVRRRSGPVAIDGRAWIEMPGMSGRETVQAPNGQFTLTLQETSGADLVRFRVSFAEKGGPRVDLSPGALDAFITSDSKWIFIDPLDVIDVTTWRRYNLSKLFNIQPYIIVRAISADGQRLYISRQPCPFDCQGLPHEYYEITFPQ